MIFIFSSLNVCFLFVPWILIPSNSHKISAGIPNLKGILWGPIFNPNLSWINQWFKPNPTRITTSTNIYLLIKDLDTKNWSNHLTTWCIPTPLFVPTLTSAMSCIKALDYLIPSFFYWRDAIELQSAHYPYIIHM